MTRDEILDTAKALISGDRDKDYGDAADNFQRIATGWEVILGADVTPVQVALCMDWVKTARLVQTPGHADSWLDKAGYSALGGEIVGKAK